jgi:membrane fusion protein, multidrug efflux system
MRTLIVTTLIIALTACSGDASKKDSRGREGAGGVEQEPITVVEVADATIGGVSDLLLASAVVESESAADLFPNTSGVVRSIHRDEGDVVSTGTLLAILENVSLDASSERADADLAQLQTQYARTSKLFDVGAVSQSELDEIAHQLSTAQATAREAHYTQGQTRIVAPFPGVVAARDVRVGELASSAARAFQVVDLSNLRVVASLPERDLARVALGQPAKLISAYDDELWAAGVVSRIAPVIDSTSGTFRVSIAVDSQQSRLRPGQFVSVQLEVSRHDDVVVIPRDAVLYEDGRAVVYAMVPAPDEEPDTDELEDEESAGGSWWPWSATEEADEDTDAEEVVKPAFVAERRLIERGLVDDSGVEVTAGVAAGDRVIVVGQSNLRDGAGVRTADMKAETEETAGTGDKG